MTSGVAARGHVITDLADIHAACWQQLLQAVRDKAHAWRVLGLATVDGDSADLRSVVLRGAEPDTSTLLFFTDARSPKVAQIAAQPRATVLAWSAALGWQLRLRVLLEVQTSGLAVSSHWARLQFSPAAQDYMAPLPPGAALTGQQVAPVQSSRNNFAVVSARVDAMDWLELQPGGHRRARFNTDGSAAWVQP